MPKEIIEMNANGSEVSYRFEGSIVRVNDNRKKIEVFNQEGLNISVFSAIDSIDFNPSLAVEMAKRMGIETLGGVVWNPTKFGSPSHSASSFQL